MSHTILPTTATAKNPPEQFTGDDWVDPVTTPQEAGQSMVENADNSAQTTTGLEHVTTADYHRP